MKDSLAQSRRWIPCAGVFCPALLVLALHGPLAAAQGTVAVSVTVESDTVLTVAISPDGRVLAGGGFGKAIRLWDARTGKVLRGLEAPRKTTRRSIVFLPDGRQLAGSGDDGVVHLWNVGTGVLERSYSGPAGIQHMSSIVISPDGRTLALVSIKPQRPDGGRDPSEVTVLDLKTGKTRWAWTADKLVYSVAFAPDGKMLAAADGAVHLLNCETGALVKSLRLDGRLTFKVAFSPDGKTLAGAGGQWIAAQGTWKSSEVFLWEVPTGKLVRKLTDLHPWLGSIAFSPDGKTLATGSSGPNRQKGSHIWVSSEVRLWDPQTGRLLRTIPSELGSVRSLAYSPDGKSLLSCDEGGGVTLSETLTGLRRLILVKSTFPPE